jgi:hypothetical protein
MMRGSGIPLKENPAMAQLKGLHIRQNIYGYTVYDGNRKIAGPFESEFRAIAYMERLRNTL